MCGISGINNFIAVCICLLFSFQINAQSSRLRILSYNIRNAKGMDNTVNYDRVAAVIKTANPSVVALQEIDSATQRSAGKFVLQELGSRTGMKYIFNAAIDYNGGKYGVGILFTEEPLSVKRVPLPGREENRTLLIAEFKDYFFCCTHFSLTPADQVLSAGIINEQIAGFTKPVYLAGDFNALPESEAIGILRSRWTLLSGTGFSFPADKPGRCIDYIFSLKSNAKLLHAEVVNEPMASDHRPVLVELAGK